MQRKRDPDGEIGERLTTPWPFTSTRRAEGALKFLRAEVCPDFRPRVALRLEDGRGRTLETPVGRREGRSGEEALEPLQRARRERFQ